VQCALFVLVGNKILEIRGMFWEYFIYMFITAASGTSLGLLISSLATDGKTAANVVPLVLIPQLIFGGALIKYEDMNKDLDMVYTFKRWLTRHPEADAAGMRDDSSLRVPLISRFVATHYSYEALVVAQAKRNPLSYRQEQLQHEMDDIVKIRKRTEAQNQRLDDLKDTLALLSGMEGKNVRDIERRLKLVDAVIEGQPLETAGLRGRGNASTERLYTNQKVTDLVTNAETVQNDIRRLDANGQPAPINVFFSPEKSWALPYYRWHWTSPHWELKHTRLSITVFTYAITILSVTSLGLLAGLYGVLKRQLRTRGT
jgi:hypothetical protein